jgi:hypothetical protein
MIRLLQIRDFTKAFSKNTLLGKNLKTKPAQLNCRWKKLCLRERKRLFWAGLLLFGFALFATFASVWGTVSSYLSYISYSSNPANAPYSYNYPSVWLSIVPYIVGGAIFMSIGL